MPQRPSPRRTGGADHQHFPALDGLRAVSIAGVVAYHIDSSVLPGGYLGVDVFFVLSGLLITRLLLTEQIANGSIRLAAFWGRRAKRLLPGLMLVLVGLGIVSVVAPLAVNPYQLRSDGLAALFYFANWHLLAANQTYFAHFGIPSPLEHTWTLAIEEQFYVVWPFLLGVLGWWAARRVASAADRGARSRSRATAAPGEGTDPGALARRMLGPVVCLTLASIAAMALVYDGGRRLDAAYFGTECRAFELLIGALLAIWLQAGKTGDRAPALARRRSPLFQLVGWIGLAGIVTAMAFARPTAFIFDGGLALVALASAGAVAGGIASGPLRQVLSIAPLQWIGRVSYEIYLWHWPVIVVTDQELHWTGAGRAAVDVGATLALTAASYYLVDRPLRRASYPTMRRRLALPVSIGATAALLAASVPLTAASAAPPKVSALGRSAAHRPTATSVFGVRLPAPTGRIALGFRPSPGHPVRVMFIGDSVMFQLELAVGAGLDATGDAKVASYSAILGWSPRGTIGWGAIASALARTRPDVVVGMWTQDNQWIHQHGIAAYRRTVLRHVLDVVFAHGDGVKGLVLAAQPPQPPPHSWMPDLHADVYDPVGARMWATAAMEEASALPGRLAYVPGTQMLAFGGHYATWLPSPGGRIERVRQTDDFHLCLNGGVRYGAGVVDGLVRLLGLREPMANWWLGRFAAAQRWYQLPHYPPGGCPNDAPTHLTASSSQ